MESYRQQKSVIDGLNETARELEHWAFASEKRERKSVEQMREKVLEGIKLIYDQENVIRALMGEYGDACDIDGCGGLKIDG